MSLGTKQFIIGALVGAAAVSVIKSATFRKGCAKVVAAGIQLKEDASEFIESVKEDAEDEAAEAKAKKA